MVSESPRKMSKKNSNSYQNHLNKNLWGWSLITYIFFYLNLLNYVIKHRHILNVKDIPDAPTIPFPTHSWLGILFGLVNPS